MAYLLLRASASHGKYTPIGCPIPTTRELGALVTCRDFLIRHVKSIANMNYEVTVVADRYRAFTALRHHSLLSMYSLPTPLIAGVSDSLLYRKSHLSYRQPLAS
ncbi:hypothetical protein GCM10020360_13540 [Nonlabens tegetincola]